MCGVYIVLYVQMFIFPFHFENLKLIQMIKLFKLKRKVFITRILCSAEYLNFIKISSLFCQALWVEIKMSEMKEKVKMRVSLGAHVRCISLS